jgi:hypothetical protein
MGNADNFLAIKDEIFDTVFGHDKRTFLLIDATLKNYGSEPELFEILKAYNVYPINFSCHELDGVFPLYLVLLESDNIKDREFFEISVRSALDALEPDNIKQGKGRCVCAWFSSQLSIEQISDFIINTAIQHIQNIGDVLIRFFDPAVLGALLDILDSWQKQRLLSNVNVWCYIDGDGIVRSLNGNGDSKKLSYSLGLTESDLLELKNIEVINKILLEYRGIGQNVLLSEIRAIQLLRPAIRFYSTHFIVEEDDDIVKFGMDVLISQKHFYLSPEFSKYLPENNHNIKKSYNQLKSMISDGR